MVPPRDIVPIENSSNKRLIIIEDSRCVKETLSGQFNRYARGCSHEGRVIRQGLESLKVRLNQTQG